MLIGTLFMDLIWFAGVFGLGLLSLTTAAEVASALPGLSGLILAFIAAPLTWIAAAAGLAGLLPKPRPGRYRVMQGRDFYAWVLNFVVRRWLEFPLVAVFWQQTVWLRWVVLRLLGARVSIRTQLSSDVVLPDPCMIRIGPGSMIGSGALISGHVLVGDKALFAPVTIGKDVTVASRAGLAPGVTIGDGAIIGPYSVLSAGAIIEAGAEVGMGAIIGTRATIGAGAVVDKGATVPDGFTVPPGARYSADEGA